MILQRNTKDKIKDIVESVLEKFKTTIHDTEFSTDEYGTFIVKVSGGLNGSGKWKNYFDTLSDFCKELEKRGVEIWFIRGLNDCPDDVFDLTFGLRLKKPFPGASLNELGWKADQEIRDAVQGSDVEEKVEDILDESAKEMGEAAEAQEKGFSKISQEIAKKYKPWQQKVIKWARNSVAKKHKGHKEFMELYEHEFPKQFKEAKPRLLKENADWVELRKSEVGSVLRASGIKKADVGPLLNQKKFSRASSEIAKKYGPRVRRLIREVRRDLTGAASHKRRIERADPYSIQAILNKPGFEEKELLLAKNAAGIRLRKAGVDVKDIGPLVNRR